MSQHELEKPDLGRRKFLAAATGAGALGAIAVVAGRGVPVEPAPLAAAEPPAHSGYRETEHIRNYYRTARYW